MNYKEIREKYDGINFSDLTSNDEIMNYIRSYSIGIGFGELLRGLKVKLSGNLDNIMIVGYNEMRLLVTYRMRPKDDRTVVVYVEDPMLNHEIRAMVKPGTGIELTAEVANTKNLSLKLIELDEYNTNLVFPHYICANGHNFNIDTYDANEYNKCIICEAKLYPVYDVYAYLRSKKDKQIQ